MQETAQTALHIWLYTNNIKQANCHQTNEGIYWLLRPAGSNDGRFEWHNLVCYCIMLFVSHMNTVFMLSVAYWFFSSTVQKRLN